VAVLGLSYKPGSPVVEASPALELALELSRAGLEVRVFDRLLAHMSDWGRGSEFAASDDLAAVVAGAEVIVAANPDPELLDDAAIQTLRSSGAHTLIDCWRLFEGRVKEIHPLRYVALGRSGIPA
jgi:UDPglucose 6-dehydrogenase